MAQGNKRTDAKMMSNDVLRGKSYLDIDRVIPEAETNARSRERKNKK